MARYFIERASRDSAGVGLATVYRALKAFMVRGEIAQVEIPGTAPRDRKTPRPARAPRSRSFAGHETLT